jgi:hypothetical protein
MKQVQRRVLGSRPGRQAGLISSSLGLALLVLAGSAAVIAGGLNLQSASSRGGDAEQAREAAEEGFNRVIDLLNDPGNSYLLVTRWANWSSNPVTLLERQTCKITSSSAGATSVASIIQTPTPLPSVGNGRQLRYTLESYTPPAHPGAAPTSCPKFGNLAGGTASLRVLGEVLRNNTVLSSFRLDRDVTVEAVEVPVTSSATSQTLSFLLTGSGGAGSDLKNGSSFYYDTGSPQWKGQSNDTRILINCLASCTGLQLPSGYSTQATSTADFLNTFPSRPPYNAADLDALTAGAIRSSNFSQWRYFPYTSSAYTDLLPYCRRTILTATVGSASNTQPVIACKISRLEPGNNDWTVYTDKASEPVVVYLIGGTEFRINGARNIINERFRLNRTTEPLSWNQLRIFGDPSSSSNSSITITSGMNSNALKECLNNNKQILKFGSNSRINGAFVWIPKGEFTFEGGATDRNDSLFQVFGAVWGCKIETQDKFVLLLNSNTGDVSNGIRQVFLTRQEFRYSARGVERSQ